MECPNGDKMKKEKVRCWEIKVRCMCGDIEILFVVSSGIFGGYELYICKVCGEIFTLQNEAQNYLRSELEDRLKNLVCPTCATKLGESLMKYPKNFKCKKTGNIYNFDKPALMPPDDESIIKEFYSIL